MTKKMKEYVAEALEKMRQCAKDSETDPEEAHSSADTILCDVLEKFGCKELVDEFEIVYKWYA